MRLKVWRSCAFWAFSVGSSLCACNGLFDIDRPVLRDETRACVEGTVACDGQTVVACQEREFRPRQACPFACVEGACSGECQPLSQRCDGDVLISCGATGMPQDAEWCDGACDVEAGCVPCEAGSLRCDGAQMEACDAEVFRETAVCMFACDMRCGGYAVGSWQVDTACTARMIGTQAGRGVQLIPGCSYRSSSDVTTQYMGSMEVDLSGRFRSGVRRVDSEDVLLDEACVPEGSSLVEDCEQWSGVYAIEQGSVELSSCVADGASCGCRATYPSALVLLDSTPDFCVSSAGLNIRVGERSVARMGLTMRRPDPLVPPVPSSGQLFGQALAADERWLLVGAPGTKQVFVYWRGDDGAWTLSATLTGGASPSRFGHAMAIHGKTVAVGDPEARQVTLFTERGGRWIQAQVLNAPGGGRGDDFGASLALSDGWLVVGAPERQVAPGSGSRMTSYLRAGAVYLYRLGAGEVFYSGPLQPGWLEVGGLFGRSLAIAGSWLAVGCRGAGKMHPEGSGTVHLFRLAEAGPELVQVLRPEFPTVDDDFGYRVALDGDWLAVGAPGEDSTSEVASANDVSVKLDSGAVFVYRLSEIEAKLQAFVKGPDATPHARFGSEVLMLGPTLVVGAPQTERLQAAPGQQEDSEPPGSAHWFAWNGEGFSLMQSMQAQVPQGGDRFGVALAPAGSSVAIGAYWAASTVGGVASARAEADAGVDEDSDASPSGLVLVVPRRVQP